MELDFEEPKNKIGQTPLDQCIDAYNEVWVDAGWEVSYEKDLQKLTEEAIKQAIIVWESLKKKERKKTTSSRWMQLVR